MAMSLEASLQRKRKRAAHACDTCRARKIRCDGAQPCTTCATSDQDCVYGGDGSSRGKSDLILETVLRMETFLQGMPALISSSANVSSRNSISRRFSAQQLDSPQTTFSGAASAESPQRDRERESTPQNMHNAVLAAFHTSTTESVLQWPHFDGFPELRMTYVSIFHLEQSRPAIVERAAAAVPWFGEADLDVIIGLFETTVNFWYPTMSRGKILASRDRILNGESDNSTGSCMATLMVCLGCAAQYIPADGVSWDDDVDFRKSRIASSEMYMDGVLKKLHAAHMEMSTTATQCLFFTALYFAFKQRPLQAWEYISATAAKCRLLLSYPPANETDEDQECLRRIFWSCYILESDYLAELSALPQSGISSIESSIPLPGPFTTHLSPLIQEKSSLYFLACISMRRLLNRVHHLLYSANSRITLSTARFPTLVSELDHQLEEWKAFLPPDFRFSLEDEEAPNQHGGFLRQRYLTCRSVIYRPYLTWVLTHAHSDDLYNGVEFLLAENEAPPKDVLQKSALCLDACLQHILHLRGFTHTVMVDTWICSLSMVGAMLILLAAVRVRELRALVGEEVIRAGRHLRGLIERWGANPVCPSVEQSLRMITEIEGVIGREVEEGHGLN